MVKGFTVLVLLVVVALSSATQISKQVKLKYAANGSIREFVLGGKLKLPDSVGITYNKAEINTLTLTGEEKDVKCAEQAISAFDIQPHQVIISFDFAIDGKSVSKPIVRTLIGYSAVINEERLKPNLKKLGLLVVPRTDESGAIKLQTSITVNEIVLVVPTGVESGDTFSYSASKAAYYLRWSRAEKTIAEYPVPESVKALGNTKVTISFVAVVEP